MPIEPKKKHFITRLGLPPLELKPGEKITIGRAPDCKIVVPSVKVSRLHAEIRWEGGQPMIADLGSQNGTLVQGKPIQERPLKSGDEIQIGPLVANYQFAEPATLVAKESSDTHSKTAAVTAQLLTGAIDKSGLGEVLQGTELNAKTGTLNIIARGFSGWATFHGGVPGAAEAGGPKNRVRDELAFFKLLELTDGRFVFEAHLKVPERRMTMTVTEILLEWSRRATKKL
ncbi:MAG TPA: FHA domain-containing protein [Planctomycetota bacterium]|nr:FHA domain-containing protein [Planctomycetota bacterium]